MARRGEIWTPAEWKKLRYWEKKGIPVSQFWQHFPGRDQNKVAKALTRLRKKRARKKNSDVLHQKRMNAEEFQLFKRFLQKHPGVSTAQLVLSWNHSAIAHGLPTVSAGTLSSIRNTCSDPISRIEQMNTEFHKKKRRDRSDKHRMEEFERRKNALTLAREEEAAVYCEEWEGFEVWHCGNCEHEWPLDEPFFRTLPGSFLGPDSERERLFNTEFCDVCLRVLSWLESSFRTAGRTEDAKNVVQMKRHARWRVTDNALLEEADLAYDRAIELYEDTEIPWELCLRCATEFPIVQDYWKHVRDVSVETANLAICTYCFRYFRRHIRRLQAAGTNPFELQWEREELMHHGRMRQLERKREQAKKNKRGKIRGEGKQCKSCLVTWPAGIQFRSQYWHVGHYLSRNGERLYISGSCVFCKAEEAAERAWQKKKEEAFRRKSLKKNTSRYSR